MPKFVLGSESAQRRNLLSSVFSKDDFYCVGSPLDEPPFDDVNTSDAIELRLQEVVRIKQQGVSQKLGPAQTVLCADTVVVVQSEPESAVVLGKPAEPTWQQQTKHWFQRHYSGGSHEVWTAWQIWQDGKPEKEGLQKTVVRFPELSETWIDWYVSTGEPEGKAGGYGIQGHAAAFVSEITGSLTNVIGLPLLEVVSDLAELGIDTD